MTMGFSGTVGKWDSGIVGQRGEAIRCPLSAVGWWWDTLVSCRTGNYWRKVSYGSDTQ